MNFECSDIIIYGDDGVAVYNGPRFLRCVRHAECGALVTHGLLQQRGSCVCGGRKFNPALKVTPEEQEAILLGDIPLLPWERELIEGDLREVPGAEDLRLKKMPVDEAMAGVDEEEEDGKA